MEALLPNLINLLAQNSAITYEVITKDGFLLLSLNQMLYPSHFRIQNLKWICLLLRMQHSCYLLSISQQKDYTLIMISQVLLKDVPAIQ
ncbi:unnamed protein product [Paramecium octaurelia]|uniref:Uncharacterized protein n=1 Tax=Paramecium octaurelia TaxID=43137 RepID=A0A8S1Y5T0_PAROT|nr:unnamed protein product [Paramecium octaurelia]